MTGVASPRIDGDAGRLDERQRRVLERVAVAERSHILALPSDDPLDAKRRARVVATGPELYGQPEAVVTTLRRNRAGVDAVAERLVRGIDRVVLVGAGDSLAVMVGARLALETALQVPCEPMQSLEFAFFGGGLAGPRTAVIALSSSGETTRTVEAMLVAQHRGAYTVALTNTPGSTLELEATGTLTVDATRVGWPTQSSTAALALLLELAVRVAELRRQPAAAALRSAFDAMPATMRDVLDRIDAPVAALAAREVAAPTVLFSGGGPTFAAAIVGAAKVKECTPLRAVEVQVEEYHHYNSQKAGEPLVLLAPSGPTVPRAVDTGTDAHRWGGRLYVVTSVGERAFDLLAPEAVMDLPVVPAELSALLYFLPAQLIGYHLGLAGFRAAEAANGGRAGG